MSQYLKWTWQTIYYLAPHLPQVQCQFQSTPTFKIQYSELNFRLLVLWRSISVRFGSKKCQSAFLKMPLCKTCPQSAIESQKTRSINDLATRLWLNNVFLFFLIFWATQMPVEQVRQVATLGYCSQLFAFFLLTSDPPIFHTRIHLFQRYFHMWDVTFFTFRLALHLDLRLFIRTDSTKLQISYSLYHASNIYPARAESESFIFLAFWTDWPHFQYVCFTLSVSLLAIWRSPTSGKWRHAACPFALGP
jgi:hypothetical protein